MLAGGMPSRPPPSLHRAPGPVGARKYRRSDERVASEDANLPRALPGPGSRPAPRALLEGTRGVPSSLSTSAIQAGRAAQRSSALRVGCGQQPPATLFQCADMPSRPVNANQPVSCGGSERPVGNLQTSRQAEAAEPEPSPMGLCPPSRHPLPERSGGTGQVQ